ncbi:hypothetical protein ACJJTC_017064 [Scirpophaga incertulas]
MREAQFARSAGEQRTLGRMGCLRVSPDLAPVCEYYASGRSIFKRRETCEIGYLCTRCCCCALERRPLLFCFILSFAEVYRKLDVGRWFYPRRLDGVSGASSALHIHEEDTIGLLLEQRYIAACYHGAKLLELKGIKQSKRITRKLGHPEKILSAF